MRHIRNDEEVGGVYIASADDMAYDNTSSGLTADDVQEAIDEVNEKVGEWSEAELLASETWGGLYGSYNKKCKIAVLRWYGNAETATAGTKDYTLPANYKPAFFAFALMKNSNGMEVNQQTEKVIIQFTANNWVTGCIMYPTK